MSQLNTELDTAVSDLTTAVTALTTAVQNAAVVDPTDFAAQVANIGTQTAAVNAAVTSLNPTPPPA